MEPPSPRRRPARPLPEAPVGALTCDAERLAKGWLIAAIEQQTFPEALAAATGTWTADAPELCAAAVRALASDDALSRLGRTSGPLDALRAVLWSALRSAWPQAEPDQVWDLGERLALVIERLGVGEPGWPGALERAVAQAHRTGRGLAVLLVELVDYDRLLAVESPEDCAAVVSSFQEAARAAASTHGEAVPDGDARVWVIAEGAGRAKAAMLATGIAEAVAGAPHWRGAPLVAATGFALLGEDGDDAGALIDAAEEAMFGAAAGS